MNANARYSKQVVSDATSAFWGVIADSFPEMTSGDSQITGEDEGAISLWVNGDRDDKPIMTSTMEIPSYISSKRVTKAVNEGIKAAGEHLFNGVDAPVVSPEVIRELYKCVCHVIYFNAPEKKPKTKIPRP